MTSYNFPNSPHVRDQSWLNRNPLHFRSGGEKARTVVVFASGVTLDSDGRRILPAGTVLNKITSGNGDGKYGPYTKTASDGRQTVSRGVSVVLANGVDVSLGDRAVAGWFANCVFDPDYVQDEGAAGDPISKFDSTYTTTLRNAFPTCEWLDD